MSQPAGDPSAPLSGGPDGVAAEGGVAPAFGKYQPFATLGRGGMADVFLSVARGIAGFNKLVVIKRLRQALAEEMAFRTMFLDEARLAARLNHPNIVHTYEVGEHNGQYFIAMEYLEGQSLNKIMKEAVKRNRPIPPVLCARIIADALGGLHHAHELKDYDGRPLGIIHRDVSPHNIFVTYDGYTKLVDFGIAKAALSNTETEVGVLKGKVAYMSPEQAAGGPIDARADVFPMGIVLWEMIAGQRLMQGDSAAQTLHRLMSVPIPRLSSIDPSIDPILDDIVARSLEKDANGRFQSAAQMRDALEGYIAHTGLSARGDDVSRKMVELFGKVREEVQRQIQRYIAAITPATTTSELRALTVESIRGLEVSGANLSGQLLRLGGSGSGSGIISAYPAPPETNASRIIAPPPQKNVAMVIAACGFFVLTLAIAFALYMKVSKKPVADDPSTMPSYVIAPPSITTGASTSTAPTVATVIASHTTAPTVTQQPTGHATGHATSPRTASTGTKPPSVPTSTEEPGTLTLDTYPWTNVTVDGKAVGPTPLRGFSVAPGSHTVVFENAEKGIKETRTFQVKSGEPLQKRFSFEK